MVHTDVRGDEVVFILDGGRLSMHRDIYEEHGYATMSPEKLEGLLRSLLASAEQAFSQRHTSLENRR
jgi:hypothetical protein